jgi:glycosyltransferase involved in cell wall biosynthesis
MCQAAVFLYGAAFAKLKKNGQRSHCILIKLHLPKKKHHFCLSAFILNTDYEYNGYNSPPALIEKSPKGIALIFTGGSGFPIGDAYTNRILAFARGFVENGCKVTLLIIYPGRNNQADESGEMDGFTYRFCAGTNRPSNWLLRKVTGARGIINSIRFLADIQQNQGIDAVITFSQNFAQNFPVYLFTRKYNIPLVRENNEFPRMVLRRGHSRLNYFDKLFFRFVNRFFDGYIYISSALVAFNRPLLPKNMPILIVPIIVDSERFQFESSEPEKLITYCGNLFGNKDGVNILLEAFAIMHLKHPEYKLMLIGNTNNQIEMSGMKARIDKLGISEKVTFSGFVHRDKVPVLLHRSAILTLARPDNIQAKGGFPTKLGEYLATGRPVLVTATSDIPRYISHGINGYLAQPGSANDFAEKMSMILSDYETAAKVGEVGKKLTASVFNHTFQAHRILRFIESLKRS